MGGLSDVAATCERVARSARLVRVDHERVRQFARSLPAIGGGAENEAVLHFRGDRDACANFVLLSDALNFCFWSDEPWSVTYGDREWTRTFAMVAGLHRAIEQDRDWLSARRWAAATAADVEAMFTGKGRIPLAERRLEVLRETGTILQSSASGVFTSLVAGVQFDARRLAHRIAEVFPSFRDVAEYAGQPVVFLKRAQICAADLHRTWRRNGFSGLREMEALTIFADYRLPQLFRHERILLLDPALAEAIDRHEVLPAGSAGEVELRAASVWIGQLLCRALREEGRDVAPWELDYELWCRARSPDVGVPHHRTISCYY